MYRQRKYKIETGILNVAFTYIFIELFFFSTQNAYSSNDWQTIFNQKKVNGTLVLYNLSSGKIKIHNEARSDSAYLPASTFKVLNSLIALEINVVNSVDDTMKWDGVDRGWEQWNKDQTMKTAIQYSCVWFYQNLARQIGTDNMQKWINMIEYGNTQMGAYIDNFWLEGDLRISAIEQVEFIGKLIQNKLPFKLEVQEEVKRILVTDSTDSYVIHSKTGWAIRHEKQIGWYVGYIETNKETWIFAMNMDIKKKSDARFRNIITYDIMRSEGIIKK